MNLTSLKQSFKHHESSPNQIRTKYANLHIFSMFLRFFDLFEFSHFSSFFDFFIFLHFCGFFLKKKLILNHVHIFSFPLPDPSPLDPPSQDPLPPTTHPPQDPPPGPPAQDPPSARPPLRRTAQNFPPFSLSRHHFAVFLSGGHVWGVTRQPENSKRTQLRDPGASKSNHHQNSTERLLEREKRAKMGAGEGKTARNFGPPTFGPPPFESPRVGLQPFGS